jgi:signal transduction histidine kinase
MTGAASSPRDRAAAIRCHARVLLLSTTPRDGSLTADVLGRAGIDAQPCADVDEAVREMAGGAGALLVAEETLLAPGAAALTQALAAQPPWSDLPVLLLARTGAASHFIDEVMHTLANVTVVERPVRVAALVSTVRVALRARARQFELRDLLHNLQQADRRKTEFLATLAHELRNPMAPLTTTLALLQHQRPTPADAQAHYAVMGRQLDHLGRLVNDLMEMSHVTRGKIALRPEALLLDHVIRDAVELSRPMLDARRQVLTLSDVAPGLAVRGDAVRLAQVFANLLNNAVKYTPPGGHIEIAARRRGEMACISVRDNGSGIPPDRLESIFEMFLQVSHTTRDAQGGLGLGLTLVRRLVELHHGSVVARSDGPGRGSEFEVSLPLVASIPPERRASSPGANHPLRGVGSVLVVDDNRDAAESLAALLDILGASCTVAYDGQQALVVAACVRPAVAILDIGMPGMDGHELAARLRADPLHGGLVLIALSGWTADDEPPRTPGPATSGFDHHLLKPPDIAALVAVLTAARPLPVPA